MKLIKLGAIDSTNEFLKGLSHKLDNFTVVIAEKQTKGRGRWVPPGRLRRVRI
jgi:BirA family biotin operon repressor/biotin-[acetyl-CoA-carboxylase] ligase